MNFKFASIVVVGIVVSCFFTDLHAQKGWYANQSLIRQQQMANQQRMMQQQRIARENQRRQQEVMRAQRQRQQKAMRAKQQRMQQQMRQRQQAMATQRAQMQKRQRTAQLKRQQLVQSRQKPSISKAAKSFNSNAKRQLALQQRSLRQQKLAKDRAEKLRKLKQRREKENEKKEKSKQQSTAVAFTALASRVNALPKTTIKPRTATELKQSRLSPKKDNKSLTKQFNKQRLDIQQKAKQLKKLSQKKPEKAEQSKLKDKFRKAAAKNFKSCNGKSCECSFHGDTGVLTAEGVVPIRDIKVGSSHVWSRNDKTGDESWQLVKAHYSNLYQQQYIVEISSLQGSETQSIISNDIHPFFVVETGLRPVAASRGALLAGKWIQAKNLSRGDILLTAVSDKAVVKNIKTKQQSFEAYNLHVANNHTYFVTGDLSTEESAVWVHNHCHTKKQSHNKGIGFTQDSVRAPLSNVGRVDHATKNLGSVIKHNPSSKAARDEFRQMASKILVNPKYTFDSIRKRGGIPVKGFIGEHKGNKIAIFIAKESSGKIKAGDILTAYKPSPQQLKNYGLVE